MPRIIVLLAIVAIGAAAPARAWCEASCLAPASEAPPHCPTHEPAGGTTAISASIVEDCPALDSARPTVPARLDAHAPVAFTLAAAPRTLTTAFASFVRPHNATTVFERCTPLRI